MRKRLSVALCVLACALQLAGCANSGQSGAGESIARSPMPTEPVEDAFFLSQLLATLNDPSTDACKRCMHQGKVDCSQLGKSPVIALVNGSRFHEQRSSCGAHEHPNPDDYKLCHDLESMSFEQVIFLRNRGRAGLKDTYRQNNEYEFFAPRLKTGVAVEQGKRYLIFAHPAATGFPAPANWDIEAACTL